MSGFEGLDGDLVAFGEIENHVTEGAFANFHEEFDGVAACTTTEAVIQLFAGTDGEAGGFVVVEGAEADHVFATFTKDDVFGHDINDVNAGFNLFDGVGMEARNIHRMAG